MSEPSNASLYKTIRTILLAFEAPPPVVDHFKLETAGSDPFAWTRTFYTFIKIDGAYGLRLQLLFVLLVISTILSVATLIFQYLSSSQASSRWFFRKQYHTQSKIPYIVPHPVNIVVLASLVTSLLLQVYLAFVYNAWNLEKWGRLIRISSWFPAAWFSFFAAVWFSGFGSLYLTYLVPSQYTRRGSLTGAKRHASPILVNALCFGVPILCVASVLPLQFKQSSEMRATMRGTRALYNVLEPLSIAWQAATDPSDQVSLIHVQQVARDALAAKRIWETYWTVELVLWSFWSLLALSVAIPFCLALVLSTHRRISRMATSQAGLTQWTNGPRTKHSPPISQSKEQSPPGSIKEGISPFPISSGLFSEPYTPASLSSVPPYSSPASSFPSSTVQTPSIYEHHSQPFFTFHSPGSFSSKSPSMSESSPADSPQTLPYLGKGKVPKLGRSYGRHSIHVLRRMSHSAVFPSRAGGLDHRAKSHLDDLNKRYWHIAAEYTTVLLVMVLICAFALFELASQSKILSDCPKKILSTIVVSFAYGCLVNAWLSYNLYRMYRESKKSRSSRSGSSSESSSEGNHRSAEPAIFEDYALAQKRPSKSLVHFADMIRNGSQYEPERRPSTPPPPSSALCDDEDDEGESKRNYHGLKINIVTELGKPSEQRPSMSGATAHQSFERRRSSYRAPSMDLTEALAMGPGSLHRRCSVQR